VLTFITLGTNAKAHLAGALELAIGRLLHGGRPRKAHRLFLDSLKTLDTVYQAAQHQRIYIVLDNYKIYKAHRTMVDRRPIPSPFCRSIVLGPTRLSTPSVICLTFAPVIIEAHACGTSY
jgi:hypothetical protein